MERPSLKLVGHEKGGAYYSWQWSSPELSAYQMFSVEMPPLLAAIERLDAALPRARAGESEKATMTRVLTLEAFAVPEKELELSTEFARLLLPEPLASEIAQRWVGNGRQPILLYLMPSPSAAKVPWELLPVSVPTESGATEVKRLIDIADIVHGDPEGIHARRARKPEAWPDGEVVSRKALYVVDPTTRSGLGSVLDDEGHATMRRRGTEHGHAASRVDDKFDRKDLHRALTNFPAPQRLVYLGHVVTGDSSQGATSLLLSDNDDMFGVTARYREVSRPLSALDLFEGTMNNARRVQYIVEAESIPRDKILWPAVRGTRQRGSEIWPMPSRVALIACNSGTDLGNPEPFGLAIALINSGALYVTATKWTLPTDHAFHDLAGIEGNPVVDAALAVDDAHASDDPVASMAEWQRARLAEWLSGNASGTASPLLWAAFSTYTGRERTVEKMSAQEETA